MHRVCVYKCIKWPVDLITGVTKQYPPPLLNRQAGTLSVFKRRSRAFGRVSPASAHTAPLRPRLGSRAGSHSAHPQPRVLPVRCHHRSALPSLANRFSQWIHLACTAAPSSCEKWPLAHAPAIGSGRSLAPAFAAAAAPGSGPSRGARKRWFTWQGFACPVAAAH